MRIDVLNQRRLTGLLVDAEDGDIVRASRSQSASICNVHELTVWMEVNRAGSLARLDAGTVRECGFAEQRCRTQRPFCYPEHLESVLCLQCEERPRTRWMKVEMPDRNPMPFDGAMDATFASLPSSYRNTLSAPGSSLVVLVG